MKSALLEFLQCPVCRGGITLVNARERGGEVESGLLRCLDCRAEYPIAHFVPRFVPSGQYTASFGFQWNRFRRTQLDSHTGTTISRDRFFRETGWSPESLQNLKVLDAGCGAGRFAEIALACGAEVFAIDYSAAVDACWENLGPHPKLHIIQADIYALPFRPAAFDRVYCFGVLQHTPNVKGAFMALPKQLRAGGRLAVDVYPTPRVKPFVSKYWLRPFTKRLPSDRLFNLVQLMVRALLPVSTLINQIPVLGQRMQCIVPVANYASRYPLSRELLYEWSLLDTFDMLAPAYDQPQRSRTLQAWMHEAGLANIEVFRASALCGRAVSPK